jgi:alcohol dehydrogenase (cytochrome c)
MQYQPLLTRYIPHAPFFGVGTLGFAPSPNANGNLGALVAWDPVKAKAVWSVAEPLPLVGPGTLSTAGGLVFYGTSDNHFKALHASTGAVLWQITLECPIVSNPITYTAPDGKQRVAVYAGSATCPASTLGGGDAKVQGGVEASALYASVPRLLDTKTKAKSGYLHVFKLP